MRAATYSPLQISPTISSKQIHADPIIVSHGGDSLPYRGRRTVQSSSLIAYGRPRYTDHMLTNDVSVVSCLDKSLELTGHT